MTICLALGRRDVPLSRGRGGAAGDTYRVPLGRRGEKIHSK